MSNLYITEPPTNGKVLITTNRGEIEIELWSRETPKACRNFVQLCLEGYYINTIFHRIVPDFIIQGGDPTGTGTGGQSIYDEPFQDEFHSRLKYSRRGLIGCANNGKNDNGSQFFITLNATPELAGKNTLFGRIVGDTIYNVTRIGTSEIESGTERPLYPPCITQTEVIVNPFPDIQPRTTLTALKSRQEAQARANSPVKKLAKKNKNLLSFAEDEDELNIVAFKHKKSSHDVLQDKHLPSNTPQTKSEDSLLSSKAKTTARKRKSTRSDDEAEKEVIHPAVHHSQKSPTRSPSPLPEQIKQKTKTQADDIQAQIAALTSTLKRQRPVERETSEPARKLSYLEQEKLKYAKKAVVGGRRKKTMDEDAVLQRLSQFQEKMSAVQPVSKTQHESTTTCRLHGVPRCQSCHAVAEAGGEEEDDSWLAHELVFEVDKLGKDTTFRERAQMELEIIDPREKAGRLALEQREARRRADEKSGRNQYLRRQ